MSLKNLIAPYITSRLLSEKRLMKRRSAYEKARRKDNRNHVIRYFHQVDDPYSHLCLQTLKQLRHTYDVEFKPYLVPPPEAWAAPERELLIAYSRLDAERLAAKSGFKFKHGGQQPDDTKVQVASALLAEAIKAGCFVDEAPEISAALWSDTVLVAPDNANQIAEMLREGRLERARLGHYLGGTYYYGQEWYWGIDRLHFLEERLSTLCAKGPYPRPIYTPPEILSRPPIVTGQRRDIDFFLSFRSPYTYIVAERLKRLLDVYNMRINLRFILPMVMRDLPVPLTKGRYIMLDVAREARRYQIPFGRVSDPVGTPVERGYALLHWAIAQNRGYEFALSFMRHVWSQGIDAGRNSGMKAIVQAAGLDWAVARPQLENDNWRTVAEANRKELLDLGIWGVPSFLVGDVAIWGQDRLWLVEDSLNVPTSTS